MSPRSWKCAHCSGMSPGRALGSAESGPKSNAAVSASVSKNEMAGVDRETPKYNEDG